MAGDVKLPVDEGNDDKEVVDMALRRYVALQRVPPPIAAQRRHAVVRPAKRLKAWAVLSTGSCEFSKRSLRLPSSCITAGGCASRVVTCAGQLDPCMPPAAAGMQHHPKARATIRSAATHTIRLERA